MYLCYFADEYNEVVQRLCYYMQDWKIQVSNTDSDEYIKQLIENSYYSIRNNIERDKYVIIVLTQKLLLNLASLVELDIVRQLFEQRKIRVFVICCDVDVSSLPKRMAWIKNADFIYSWENEAEDTCLVYDFIFKVLDIYLHDQITKYDERILCEQLIHFMNAEDKSVGSLQCHIEQNSIGYPDDNEKISRISDECFEPVVLSDGSVPYDVIKTGCLQHVYEDAFINKMLSDYRKACKCNTKITILYSLYNYVAICCKPDRNRLLWGHYIIQLYEMSERLIDYDLLMVRICEQAMELVLQGQKQF